MYQAKDVAAYIINKQVNEGYPINNLKLQKILYFVQAEFLVTKDEPCFNEVIKAWDFGPVIESVYKAYAVHGGNSIFSPIKSDFGYHIKNDDRELIDGILDEVKNCSVSYLTDVVHHQTPWIKGRNRLDRIITNESIEDFFAE